MNWRAANGLRAACLRPRAPGPFISSPAARYGGTSLHAHRADRPMFRCELIASCDVTQRQLCVSDHLSWQDVVSVNSARGHYELHSRVP